MLTTFNELFALVFLAFEDTYSKAIAKYLSKGGNPAFTIMQFNPIREKFFKDLEARVDAGKFDSAFIIQAKEGSKAVKPTRAVDTEAASTTGGAAAPTAPLHLPTDGSAAAAAAAQPGGDLISFEK